MNAQGLDAQGREDQIKNQTAGQQVLFSMGLSRAQTAWKCLIYIPELEATESFGRVAV